MPVAEQGRGLGRLAVQLIRDFPNCRYVAADGLVDQGLGYELQALDGWPAIVGGENLVDLPKQSLAEQLLLGVLT